jgi:hypothetical protein
METMKRGDRVRLSAKNKAPHFLDVSEGTVRGVGKNGSSWVYVRWDGRRAPTMVPMRFLEGFAEAGTDEGAEGRM